MVGPDLPWGLELVSKISYSLAPRSDAAWQLRRIAHEQWGRRTRLGAGPRRDSVLRLTLRGRARIRLPRQTLDCGPGQVLLHPVGCPIEELTVPGPRPWEILLVSAAGRGLEAHWQDCFGGGIRVVRPANVALVEQQARVVLGAAAEGGPLVQRVADHGLRALLGLVRNGIGADSRGRDGAFATFEQCKRHIDTHYQDLTTATDIAAACGIDRAYLARQFRRHADDSPYAYLQRLKLVRASELVQEGRLTLDAIAEAVGYGSGFALSKAFRRHFGVSPQGWLAG